MTEHEQQTDANSTDSTTEESLEGALEQVESTDEVVEEPPQDTPQEEDVATESETEVVEETPAEESSQAEDASAKVEAEVVEETHAEESSQVEDASTKVEVVEETPDEDTSQEDSAQDIDGQSESSEADEPRTREGMSWFVLRVASNKEDYVRSALEKKVQIEGVQHLVGRIMVPTEKTKTLTKTGKAKITETKLYPGYIFVEMQLVDQRISQDVFFLIKETIGVGDFVGTAGKPTPMSNDEVDKMLYDSQAPEEVTEVKLEFAKGDHVNVREGPFMGHEGTVDEIYPDKGVVRVLATVFGRQTPLDIEYWMIEKAD